jgi:anti-sigma factor RsiW
MHDSVKLRLEEYLQGGAPMPEMDKHLRTCEECRKEIDAMRMQALLFRTLKAPSGVEPGAGFYTKVMNRVESQAKPSVWSLFGDSLFARRLLYASAMFLVLVGSYAVSSISVEDEYAAVAPVSIIAGNEAPAPVSMESARDREVVLVTLATWGNGGEAEEAQDWQ